MPSDSATSPALSPRELEILGHLAEGATYQAIARKLGLSRHTVDTYIRRLRSKSGTNNRSQLVLLAFQLGYVPRPARVERWPATPGSI